MTLATRNPGDTIRSLDVDQFLYALTGSMADQPITIGQMLQAVGRAFQAVALVSPTITSYTITGGAGSTTHNYQVISSTADGDALPLANFPVTNAPASLSGTNYVTINWNPQVGAANYKILRDGQQIGTVPSVNGQSAAYSFNDTGQAASGYTAATYPTGGSVQANQLGSPARLVGSQSGAPTTGTWNLGDYFVDPRGIIFMCTAAGTPGTWNAIGPGQVYCQVYMAAGTFTIPNNAETLIPLETKTNDPNTNFNTTTHLYTCPVAGLYRVSGYVLFQALGVGLAYNPAYIAVYKNGVNVKTGNRLTTPTATQAVSPGVSTIIRCAAADTLGLYGYQTSGGAANSLGGSGSTYMDIEYRGAN